MAVRIPLKIGRCDIQVSESSLWLYLLRPNPTVVVVVVVALVIILQMLEDLGIWLLLLAVPRGPEMSV